MSFELPWLLPLLLLLFLGLACWTALRWPAARTARHEDAGDLITVLIPARNEKHNIEACLESVLQQGKQVCEVIVLDDNSEDNTAAIVRNISTLDPRIRLVSGSPLPEGWSGKCWACQQLADNATSEWMLFLDADARLAPQAAGRIVATARHFNCTMLSAWPGMQMLGFWEQLLMPLLNFLTFTMYPAPLAYIRRNDASLGLAHGACILLRREQYHHAGGHAAVRDALFEDTKLARHWRKINLQSGCIDGSRLVSVRMYDSLPAIFLGFEKNFYSAFGNSLGFFAFLLFHLALFLLPFILLVGSLSSGNSSLLPAALTASLLVLASRLVLSLRFRHPLWSILLHPLAELLLLAIALNSWWRTVTGRGVRWKGRTYHAAGSEAS